MVFLPERPGRLVGELGGPRSAQGVLRQGLEAGDRAEVKIYNEDWEELSLQPLLLALEMIQEQILVSEEELALVYEWSQDIEKKLSGRLEPS